LGAVIAGMIADDDFNPEPVTSSSENYPDPAGQKCEFNPDKNSCPDDYFCLDSFPKCNKAKTKAVPVPSCVLKCPTNDSSWCGHGIECKPMNQTAEQKKHNILPKRGYCVPKTPVCKKKSDKKNSNVGEEKKRPGAKV
jgi:hypothetical protein